MRAWLELGGGQQRSADLRRHWRWSPDCALSVASSHQLMEPVFTLRVSSLIQKQRHRDTAQQDTEHCRIQSTAALQHTAGAGGGPLVEIWLSESHLTAPHRLGTCHQWGPQLSVATCVTTRPAPLHTADTNICSELGLAACSISTLQHSTGLSRSTTLS